MSLDSFHRSLQSPYHKLTSRCPYGEKVRTLRKSNTQLCQIACCFGKLCFPHHQRQHKGFITQNRNRQGTHTDRGNDKTKTGHELFKFSSVYTHLTIKPTRQQNATLSLFTNQSHAQHARLTLTNRLSRARYTSSHARDTSPHANSFQTCLTSSLLHAPHVSVPRQSCVSPTPDVSTSPQNTRN